MSDFIIIGFLQVEAISALFGFPYIEFCHKAYKEGAVFNPFFFFFRSLLQFFVFISFSFTTT